jgi:sialate O-acetylesterase
VCSSDLYRATEWRAAPAKLGDYQVWGVPDLAQFTGLLWYRTTIHLSAKQAKAAAKLHLGGVDEVDQTWINGKIIGNTFGYGAERTYDIPANILHAGDNTLVVNVTNTYASGGLVGDWPRTIAFANGESVPLTSEWQYLKAPKEYEYPPRASWEAVGGLTGMYNGMIAPLGHYGIRGALWYQGESNTGESKTYQSLLAGLFADWRNQFGSDLPFLVVQLPDYGPRASTPTESGWAEIREAERLAVANDKHAGLAVTIDVGDPSNLHPPDKQSIGKRLARAARQVIYGENMVPSGPTPKQAHRDANSVVIAFGDIEQGLVAYGHYGPIGFELCGGAKGSCQFGDAHFDGANVMVTAANMQTATRVRYCWADSPLCNLYDRNELPAGPFEIDIH